METVCFCFELVFWCWKPLLKLGGTNFKKHFPASRNHLLWFPCQTKQFLCIVETYFLINASFGVVETDFLANFSETFMAIFSETPAEKSLFSVYWKRFFEWIFHSGYWRRIFFSNGDCYFTWKLFTTSRNRLCYEWKTILRTELVLAGGNWFFG